MPFLSLLILMPKMSQFNRTFEYFLISGRKRFSSSSVSDPCEPLPLPHTQEKNEYELRTFEHNQLTATERQPCGVSLVCAEMLSNYNVKNLLKHTFY